MTFSDLALSAYAKLHAAFKTELDRPVAEHLSYEYPSPTRTQPAGPLEFKYDLQESDFTRELVNAFNKYAYWLNRLALWEGILPSYSEDEAFELRYEFTALLLDYCLHAPYSFKGRLVFCATQLCYTRGLAGRLISKDQIVSDEKINFGTLMGVAKHWPTGQTLVAALKAIDDDQHREATRNYRHKAQHRQPPCLDLGYTANIEWSFEPGSVGFSFGNSPPLKTADLLPVLAAQAKLMRAGFCAYRGLVDEHRMPISTSTPGA